MTLSPSSSHGADLGQANTWAGNQTAPAFIASGLTGATAASRYVGATASGAPASGTFAVGDYVIDQTGKLYVCTVAGSPGTWAVVGSAALTNARAVGSGGGDFTTTSASFTDITGASMTIAAAVGDVLLCTAKFVWSTDGVGNTTQWLVKTTTGSNTIDAANLTSQIAGYTTPVTFAGLYTVVSGDISGGNVAIKAQVASDGVKTVTIQNGSYKWRMLVVNLLH